MKRKIALLLVIALLLSFIPVIVVNAAETTVVYQKISTMAELTTGQYVMVLDGTGYAPTKYNNKWVEVGKPTLSGNEITEANATSYIWNLTVSGTSVTLTDSAGQTIKPNSTSSASITTDSAGTYTWTASCTNGTFRFTGTGSYTGFILAANKTSSYKIRAYKSGSASANTGSFPSYFTLYKRVEITNDDPAGTEAPTTAPTEVPTEAPKPTYNGTFYKLTAENQLTTGKYVMVLKDSYAMTVFDATNWVLSDTITVTGDSITNPAEVMVWDIAVTDGAVTLKDSNGAFIKPNSTSNASIGTGEHNWDVVYTDGTFQFVGTGDYNAFTLAANSGSSYKLRAYKSSTVSGNPTSYPSFFTLYRLVENGTELPTVPPTTEPATPPTTEPTEPATTEPATEAPTQAPDVPVADEATIVFDSTDKRTEYSTTKQVWGENNITVTNDKASSSSNVGDYVSPARFYKSSKLTIAYPKAMTKIEFTCNTADYASDLQQTISGSTVNGKVVTVVLAEAANTFEVSLTVGKVFVDSIKVYTAAVEVPTDPTEPATEPTQPTEPTEPQGSQAPSIPSGTQDNIVYVTGSTGKYSDIIVNWGTRGEVSTTLSPMAIAFYNANNTSYGVLSALSGSSTVSGVPSSPLYAELQELMVDNHDVFTTYDDLKEVLIFTDAQQNDPITKLTSLYTGEILSPDWDDGTWNREHVWPKSKNSDGDTSNGNADVMALRPTNSSVNSSRSDKAYGTVTNNNYFYPNEKTTVNDVRGDVARSILYSYVRWNYANTSTTFGASGVIESVEVMLTWMEEDPVDTWEMGRNDSVESITGTRNVFIDFPELAFVLFGESVPASMQTPSGNAGSQTPTDPTEPSTPATEPEGIAPLPTEDGAVITIEQALLYSAELSDYTTIKYKVTGQIINVYNTTYGNLYIQDDKGNVLTIYGTFNADGTVRYDAMDVKPVAGDTITVYGVLGQYNGIAQIKDGWIVEHIANETPTDPTEPSTPTTQPTETPTEPAASGSYNKITSLDELTSGKYVMIVSNGVAMTIFDGSGWVLPGTPVVDGDTITLENANGFIWDLVVDGTSVTLQDTNGAYIKPKSGNTNGIVAGEYSWNVTCTDGTFRFSGTGSDTTSLAYNATSGQEKFRSYKNGTIDGAPQNYLANFTLYKLTEGEAPIDPTDPTDPTETTTEPTTEATEPVVTMTMQEIVDAAYELSSGASMEGTYTLTGVITRVNTSFSSQYGDVTVTIAVADREDKPVMCYRLVGEGIDVISVGDTITVTGKIKNYNGTIEFDRGCTLDSYTKGEAPEDPTAGMTMQELVDYAYQLPVGGYVDGKTLTGKIIEVNTEYSAEYNNITVTIVVEGREDKPIECYRLVGQGVDVISVGDTITVTGTLTNYNGKIEFNTGCILDSYDKLTAQEIVDAAYALEAGQVMEGPYTLTGVITRVKTIYDAQYQEVTVIMAVEGCEDKPIVCFRLRGEGADQIAVGDTITVSGTLSNYEGVVQFDMACTLDSYTKGEAPESPLDGLTMQEIVDAAYNLEDGGYLDGATLTGVITQVDTAYVSEYKYITVTIAVEDREDKPIRCYWLKGDGVNLLDVGDTITVYGNLINFEGIIEFDVRCRLVSYEMGEKTMQQIVDTAYKLTGSQIMEGYTLTGVITEIGEVYTDEYQNITVTIVIEGRETKPIVCYRMKGDGMDLIAIGDTVTVTGNLINYNGKIEFNTGAILDSYVMANIQAGSSYSVHLIEPWALRANIMFANGSIDNLIPVAKFTDYGAYAIIGNKLEGATAEELMADPDAVKYTKADGNITVKDATTLTFDFYDGLYSYNLGESVYWVAYFVTADGTYYTSVQTKSLTDVADSLLGKDDVSDTEKEVLQSMKDLKDAVIALRGEDANLGNVYAPGVANTGLGDRNTGYQFGTSSQIKLIEPWGVRVRVLMREKTAAAGVYADYENADDYGVIFFHDKTGKYNGSMTAAQMSAETDAKVYSKSNGNAAINANGVTAVYDQGIYTYDLDKNLYCLPYIVVDGEYYYPANATCWNLLGEMTEYSENTNLSDEEIAVFKTMLEMYENVQEHLN